MKKFIVIFLLFGLATAPISHAALTAAEENFVKAKMQIKDLKKQIEVKIKEKRAAVAATRKPFDTEISSLQAQLETAAISIGLTLDDVLD